MFHKEGEHEQKEEGEKQTDKEATACTLSLKIEKPQFVSVKHVLRDKKDIHNRTIYKVLCDDGTQMWCKDISPNLRREYLQWRNSRRLQ